MIRVAIIEDEPIVITGIKAQLQDSVDFDFIGEANSGDEGIRLCARINPDVVLLDINLPDINGVTVAKRILKKNPQIKILAFSSRINPITFEMLRKLGVNGFIKKIESSEILDQGIKIVAEGRPFLCKGTVDLEDAPNFMADWSNNMRHVFISWVMDIGAFDTANSLSLSEKTVRNYRSEILKSTQCKNFDEILMLSRKFGFRIR